MVRTVSYRYRLTVAALLCAMLAGTTTGISPSVAATKPTPSPSPTWPPAGFSSANGVYARIPTGKELLGILVAKSDPVKPVSRCSPDPKKPKIIAMSCGAVLVAATSGCSWWEINSKVTGIDPADATHRIVLGTLRVLDIKTKPRAVSTIILVSGAPLKPGVRFVGIKAKCWLTPPTEKVPKTIFIPAPNPSATPFASPEVVESPTPSASDTPSPTDSLPVTPP